MTTTNGRGRCSSPLLIQFSIELTRLHSCVSIVATVSRSDGIGSIGCGSGDIVGPAAAPPGCCSPGGIIVPGLDPIAYGFQGVVTSFYSSQAPLP